MKHSLFILKNKWHLPFHLGSAFMPAALLLGAYAIPTAPYLAGIMPAIYLLAVVSCMFVPDKYRLAAGIIWFAGILYTGFRQLIMYKSPALVFPPLLYAWLLMETLPLFGRDCRDEMPPHVFVLGIVLHLAGHVALFITGINENPVFAPIKPGLSAAFVCFFLLTLLNLNRTNLLYVAAMEKSIPRHIYRFNRMLTIALAALTVFVGCMPAVVKFFRWLWNSAIDMIAALIAWINSLFPAEETLKETGPSGDNNPLFAYAESEPSLFAKILEILLYVIMIVFVLIALWAIVKYIRRFIRWLWKRILEYAASTGTGDYVDEISDTREDGERRRIFSRLHRKNDPLRGVNERRLPPAQRIRFYYLKLLVHHKEWKLSHTARENLPKDAAVIYERARYSAHDVSEADARIFLDLTSERK